MQFPILPFLHRLIIPKFINELCPNKISQTENCVPKFIPSINNRRMVCDKTLSRDKTGRQTLTYHCTLSHGGFRRGLSRDTVPRTSIYNFEPSKMEVNDVENLHGALCHPLAQLTACTSAAHVSLSSMVRRTSLT